MPKASVVFFIRLCNPACSCFTTRSSQLEKILHKTLKQRAFNDKLNIIKQEYKKFKETQPFDSALKIYDNLREMSVIFTDLDKKDNLQVQAQNIIATKFLFAKYLLDNFSQKCISLEDKKIESMRSNAAKLHDVTIQALVDCRKDLCSERSEIRITQDLFTDSLITIQYPSSENCEAENQYREDQTLHNRISKAYKNEGKLPDDCQQYKLSYNKESNLFYIGSKEGGSDMVLMPVFDLNGAISKDHKHRFGGGIKPNFLTIE